MRPTGESPLFDDIENSYPPFDEAMMSASERELFAKLPKDYQEFLRSHNGGFVRDFRYSFLTGVPYKTEAIDNPSRDDCVVEFLGIPTTTSEGRWPASLILTAEEHRAAKFLPDGIIAIAICIQSSLVCVSLRPADRGAIYYWDYYWRYPWCKSFFEERIEGSRARVKDSEVIMENPHHPDFPALVDALNFATLVKLSDSFSGWCHSCFDGSEDDADERGSPDARA